jgi:hypothetical protein
LKCSFTTNWLNVEVNRHYTHMCSFWTSTLSNLELLWGDRKHMSDIFSQHQSRGQWTINKIDKHGPWGDVLMFFSSFCCDFLHITIYYIFSNYITRTLSPHFLLYLFLHFVCLLGDRKHMSDIFSQHQSRGQWTINKIDKHVFETAFQA